MRIKNLDHIALVVDDLERARWFYGQVLCLEEIPRPPTFTFRGCWFQGEGFQLHLILAEDTTAPAGFGEPGVGARSGLAHHLGLEVEDLGAIEARLRAYGVDVLSGPLSRGDGVVQLYLNDPDGNFLELFVRDPRSALPARERAAVNADPTTG